MNIYIVIPAHNEEAHIKATLDSLVQQTLLPKKLVVVDDNSTDSTSRIVKNFCKEYDWISLISTVSSDHHLPGTKIINAFYQGFNQLDQNFDVICKYDADLIFPKNYLKKLAEYYQMDPRTGMVAGHCFIKKNKAWVLESITNTDHIRGGLKSYRKACFEDIGGLKRSMGWDTIDELLALYYKWNFKTDLELKVKHLKPTGNSYSPGSKYLQGEALYKMRFGIVLALLSALKLAYKKNKIQLFKLYLTGYLKSWLAGDDFLITKKQGRFIRKYRWRKLKNKFINLLP